MMGGLTWKEVVKPSRYFASLLLTLHLGSVLVAYLSNIHWLVKWALFALIAASLLYYWMRDVSLRLPFSWRGILLNGNDVAVLTQANSKLTGMLSGTSLVFSYFVVLRVKLDGHYFSTSRVVFRDALNLETFRQLCVYLKYSRLALIKNPPAQSL
jgi:hypothetical protein